MFENLTSSYTLRLSVLSPALIERSCSKLKTRLQKLGMKQNVKTVCCNVDVSKIDLFNNVWFVLEKWWPMPAENSIKVQARQTMSKLHNHAAIQGKLNCAEIHNLFIVVPNIYKPAAFGNGDISLFALEMIGGLDSFVCRWVSHVFQLYLPE